MTNKPRNYPPTISNLTIQGAKVGIHVAPGSNLDLSLRNVRFDNVETPLDLAGASRVDIHGTRITNDPKHQSATGWSRPAGPPLPAFCPNCKAIFASQNYVFDGAYFNAWDNEETCTNCSFEHARLSEGIFNLAKNTVEIISAPDITYAMVQSLRDAADDIVHGRSKPEEAIAKLSEKSPHLGELLRRAVSIGMSAVTLLASAAGIASLYYGKQSYDAAREQVVLAKEANEIARSGAPSPDLVVEQVLRALRDQTAPLGTPPQKRTEHPSAGPSREKTASKSKLSKSLESRKPKARELRRETRRNKRVAFSRSHGRTRSCDPAVDD